MVLLCLWAPLKVGWTQCPTMANFSLQYIVSKKAEAIQFPFCSPTTFLCSEEERKKSGVFFFFLLGETIYMLLKCSSTHYPAAESAPVCKYRRCVCVWSSLECVAAEWKAGKLLRMAVPVMTCQHRQPGLWWWRGIMGASAALRVSRTLGVRKLEGCPIPGSPGVCLSPLGPYNWHTQQFVGLGFCCWREKNLICAGFLYVQKAC